MSEIAEPQAGAGNNTAQADSDSVTQTLTEGQAWGKLGILSGAQLGATARLESTQAVTVGRVLDNDIVLRDPSIESVHASLALIENTITIQCLGRSLIVDGQEISEGMSIALPDTAIIQLGEVALSVEKLTDMSVPGRCAQAFMFSGSSIPEATFEDIPALSTSGSENSALSDEMGGQSRQVASAGKDLPRARRLLSIALLVTGGLIVWQSGLFRKPAPEPVSLSHYLAASPFAALSIDQSGNSAILSGYLESMQESIQLSQWLEHSGVHVNNKVVVGEILSDKVHDVFRVHGVPAEVLVSRDGTTRVATAEADIKLLDTISGRVRRDVPGIAALSIDNKPPPPVDEPIVVDPGKRVALVVSDKPAHVLTEDRSRYFVGAVLPTGHQILSITEGVVSITKNSIVTKLEF